MAAAADGCWKVEREVAGSDALVRANAPVPRERPPARWDDVPVDTVPETLALTRELRAPRRSLRRADDALCTDAGVRPGRRPPCRVPVAAGGGGSAPRRGLGQGPIHTEDRHGAHVTPARRSRLRVPPTVDRRRRRARPRLSRFDAHRATPPRESGHNGITLQPSVRNRRLLARRRGKADAGTVASALVRLLPCRNSADVPSPGRRVSRVVRRRKPERPRSARESPRKRAHRSRPAPPGR